MHEYGYALNQRTSCIHFLQQQQDAWIDRLKLVQRAYHNCDQDTVLWTACNKEIAMIRGLLLTLRRRIKEWETACGQLETQRAEKAKQAVPEGVSWGWLDELLSDLPDGIPDLTTLQQQPIPTQMHNG